MSHNAIGNRDNGKVHRDSVVVLYETPRHRGSSRTNLQVPVLRLKSLKFSRNLLSVHTDYDAPESRWRRQGTLATSQIKEGILLAALTVYLWCIRCNADLHELFEKIFCIPVTSASVERGFRTCGLSMQPHSARVGNELLSELMVIKSSIKPQPVL